MDRAGSEIGAPVHGKGNVHSFREPIEAGDAPVGGAGKLTLERMVVVLIRARLLLRAPVARNAKAEQEPGPLRVRGKRAGLLRGRFGDAAGPAAV